MSPTVGVADGLRSLVVSANLLELEMIKGDPGKSGPGRYEPGKTARLFLVI